MDSRRTVRQMAENIRGSPVLRRIASALSTMSVRLEARLLQFRTPNTPPGYLYHARENNLRVTSHAEKSSAAPATSTLSPFQATPCIQAEAEYCILMEFSS